MCSALLMIVKFTININCQSLNNSLAIQKISILPEIPHRRIPDNPMLADKTIPALIVV